MKLKWYCGMNVNAGEFFTECNASGVYELNCHEEIDWEDDLTPCIQCTDCGQTLEDPSHYTVENPMLRGHKGSNGFSVYWAPPFPECLLDIGDHALFEGGVWAVMQTSEDEFDDRDQKLSLQWVSGPRMIMDMTYVTGVCATDVRRLNEMEVIAYASKEDE